MLIRKHYSEWEDGRLLYQSLIAAPVTMFEDINCKLKVREPFFKRDIALAL